MRGWPEGRRCAGRLCVPGRRARGSRQLAGGSEMSGGPWMRFQRPATQAQSDLPMQIAAVGPMRGDALQMAARAAAANSPSPQYPYKTERYLLDQNFAVGPALRAAQELELPGVVNGPGDAFRHILWAAELTRKYGPRAAADLLNQHETNEERTSGVAASRRHGQAQQCHRHAHRTGCSGLSGCVAAGTIHDRGELTRREWDLEGPAPSFVLSRAGVASSGSMGK